MTIWTSSTTVIDIMRPRREEAVQVLADAFASYPLMDYFFADLGPTYPQALQALFRFACEKRLALGDPLLGSVHGRQLVGVAGLNGPESRCWPDTLKADYAHFLSQIGPAAAERFDQYAALVKRYQPRQVHFGLGMLGVLPAFQGQGHARGLLDAVHALSAAHPTSTGVFLDTQVATNVSLYEHAGYQVLGYERPGTTDMWFMFRPNQVEDLQTDHSSVC